MAVVGDHNENLPFFRNHGFFEVPTVTFDNMECRPSKSMMSIVDCQIQRFGMQTVDFDNLVSHGELQLL